ncbi:MAG: DnaD domain protein [Ruminococcus sp.]|nr:DnaD domain protein [Ruminococcus sp.]
MIYKIDLNGWGRFFTVPCRVVDEHIKLADGNFIKVLLCVLSGSSNTVDTELISKQSGLKETTIRDALMYWSSNGIISAEGLPKQEENAVAAAAPILTSPEPAVKQEEEAKVKVSVRYSPKELANKLEEDDQLKYIVSEYEKIKGTTIKDNEITGLMNLKEYYGFDAQALLLIIEYCHDIGKDSIAYIERVAKDWSERDINSFSEVEAEIIRLSASNKFAGKVIRSFGLTSRPTKRQLEYIESWRQMGFTAEMIEIAYNICMDATSKLNFKYIDTILKNWAGKNIRTPEQAEADEKNFRENAAKKQQQDKKDTSYDLDKWEKLSESLLPVDGGNE